MSSPDATSFTSRLIVMLALAVVVAPRAEAQRAALYEQVSLAASHNGALRSRFPEAYRLVNAAEFARSQLFDALRDADVRPERRDTAFAAYLAGDLFVRPPRLPASRTGGGQPFRQLVPEAAAILDWTYALRRQVYDVLSSGGNAAEQTGRITELLGYYRSRPALAISARPKDVPALNAQFGATAFRASHPTVNGQLWATQWLELAIAEALLVPGSGAEHLARAAERFREMLRASPAGAPYLMPVSTAVAPVLASRFPDVAAILDNLHLLQDYIADIMVAPDIPRSAHRRELLRAIQFFREDTTAAVTYVAWMSAPETMGARNMGGVAVGFPVTPDEPTVARGISLAAQAPAAMSGMEHAGMQMNAVQDTAALRAVLDRMLADPVIRERVATDPTLQRMLPQAGVSVAGSMQTMGDMEHGDMNMPTMPKMADMPNMAGMQHANMAVVGATAAMTEEERRVRTEFILRLLADPSVESRIHADPRLHRLWSDPDVQWRLQELRRARPPRNP